MHKVLLASITALFLATGTTPTHATITACAFVKPTPDGFLNLRKEPRMGAKILRRVESGDILLVVAETSLNPWTKVEAVLRNEEPGKYLGVYASTRFLRFFHCKWDARGEDD
jgi:hypothetical protein